MMTTVQESREIVTIGGRDISFVYPDSGNASMHFRNILAGTDYAPLSKWWTFNPSVIVDIGANVGATAFCFRQRYPDTNIYCFEPAAQNLTYLHRNVANLHGVSVLPFGLYGEDRKTELFHGNVQCLQHSIFKSPEVNSSDAETITLHDAFESLKDILVGRAILKIDTEGCELPILKRIHPLLPNVDIIYLEYHHEEQRRLIDQLLPTYSILAATAKNLHRGNIMYGSKRLVDEHPQLDAWGLIVPD
jgi:FkbM family methyltransferase